VKRGLLVLIVALVVVSGTRAQSNQGSGATVRKSPLAVYAGTWIGSFDGKTWLTIKLTLQADQMSGAIQHPRHLEFNDAGLLKSVSEDQTTESVQNAEVNPNGLLLTTKDPDTQETNRYTMTLTGESTADVKMSAMKIPPGMPKIKPWKVTRSVSAQRTP